VSFKIINAGGLLGVMFFNPIERKKVSADNIVDNILHLIQLNNGSTKGIALGSDYDGNVIVPLDISDLNIITDKLLQKGVSKNDIKLIMGENVKNYFINYL
jgi:membrane dipeptidase